MKEPDDWRDHFYKRKKGRSFYNSDLPDRIEEELFLEQFESDDGA